MPANHFLNTPEALLGRNDSKNPATTCKGITGSGRPCRRALAVSKTGLTDAEAVGGVIAVIKQDTTIADAQYYCWQHKDQAGRTESAPQAGSLPARKQTEILELKNRSSIDTLVQRLGIIDHETRDNRHKTRRPIASLATPSPLLATGSPRPHGTGRSSPKKPGFWASLCCVATDGDDTLEVVRRRRRLEESSHIAARTSVRPAGATTQHVAGRPSVVSLPAHADTSPLSLIPTNTSPQIASSILGEISKPFSVHDEEGYIYVFWLTPSDRQSPGDGTARALLSPGRSRQEKKRRISDVMTEYSYGANDDIPKTATKTILLKIGRANNVTRRMNEWERQCGHRLNLVRWYPYTSAASAPSPLSSPSKYGQPLYPDLSQHQRPAPNHKPNSDVRKMPNVKRVERLIHLELAEQQAKQACAACGREHREWFRVEASEHGIRRVDAIVRRWVDWSERVSCQ